MTDEPNACDFAVARYHAAMQAIMDRQSGDPTKPVNASFTLTGAPTDEELSDEIVAASAAVEVACKGNGPSR